MAVAIRARLKGDKRVVALLRKLSGPQARQAKGRALLKGAFLVQKIASEDKIRRGGKGPPHPTQLTSRTGTGRRSIRVNRSPLPDAVEIGSDLDYMALHETGGTIQVPEIRPRNARALRFEVNGEVVFATRTRAHVVHMPARPWLEPAVDDASKRMPDLFVAELEALVR